jgi:hypothetical protein
MKINSKYILYIPIAVIVLTIVGFIVKPESSTKQSVSDVVLGIYSPILILFGGILALAVIIWIIRQGAKLSVGTGASQAIALAEKVFSRAGNVIPIVLGWLVFVATILYLHQELWDAWYGNQPLFWLSQAVFTLLLIAFHSHKEFFYILITTVVIISLWFGFSEELRSKGLIKVTSVDAKEESLVGKTGQMCWYETAKGAGWDVNKDNEMGCFRTKVLGYRESPYYIFVEYHDRRGVSGTCKWDVLKDPERGIWKQLGRKNGGDCTLIPKENGMFMGTFTSYYTKGVYTPGDIGKYAMELKLP